MFGERNGFAEKKEPQLNAISNTLRNRLYNAFREFIQNVNIVDYPQVVSYIVDKLGGIVQDQDNNQRSMWSYFFNSLPSSNWYDVYSIIELALSFERDHICCTECAMNRCPNDWCLDSKHIHKFVGATNLVLAEENAGYRLINDVFVPITSKEEIDAVKMASAAPYDSVKKQIDKAISSFSEKAKPDYENTIKDAICAVEAMCCIITNDRNATLGSAMNRLEKAGICIHPDMKEAFKKLYHYTSDEGGIRHGAIDFKDATIEDARFMLVSCSAFVNYLIAKYEKIEHKQDDDGSQNK